MKVLITGGMGVIGSTVSRTFVHEGYRPVLMARHLDRDLIRPIEDKVDIELGDVLDFPRVLSILQSYNVTHVIHLAALIGALSNKNPPQSIKINVIGTLNILEAARFMKVRRVIYMSAKGVYGHIDGEYAHPTYRPLTEDHPKNPVRIYESAKLMGEHIGEFYQRTYGLEFAALRASSSYGPGKTVRHGGMAVVSKIIEGAHAGNPVKISKGADQKNDFIYNKDIAHGIYLACTASRLNHTAYNLGTGVGVTLGDVAAEVTRVIPQADIEIGPGLHYMEGPTHYYCIYDVTRARQDLGFSPQFTLSGSIEDYIETLQELGPEKREGE